MKIAIGNDQRYREGLSWRIFAPDRSCFGGCVVIYKEYEKRLFGIYPLVWGGVKEPFYVILSSHNCFTAYTCDMSCVTENFYTGCNDVACISVKIHYGYRGKVRSHGSTDKGEGNIQNM